MQTRTLLALGAAVAGLALGRPALAQTTPPLSGSVSDATTIPRIPTSSVPGDPGVQSAPSQSGKVNTLYPNGVPARDLDAGNSRAAQPRSGQAMSGGRPTKSIFKGRKRE